MACCTGNPILYVLLFLIFLFFIVIVWAGQFHFLCKVCSGTWEQTPIRCILTIGKAIDDYFNGALPPSLLFLLPSLPPSLPFSRY